MEKKIAILGATGSVGLQAIDVVRSRGYKVGLLSANTDSKNMESLARELLPERVVMADESAASDLSVRLSDTSVRVLSGADAICDSIAECELDTVVNAIIGEAGLKPTLATIDAGKRLALANKESLVIAGDVVMNRLGSSRSELIPVDSEHSAIFQSLKSGTPCEIKRIFLTASGGPFYGMKASQMKSVTLEDTLRHPTWRMGRKITVDSATLMNKGFELIEAVHLFGVEAERVKVIIHRESILHSAVEFRDNTVIAELSVPDMRMCVQYAIDYPSRLDTASAELDLISLGSLSFAEPDTEAFPLLALAKRAISEGGAVPAVMNAADEVAVAAFLDGRIGFADIPVAVAAAVDRLSDASRASELDEIISLDRQSRRYTTEFIEKIRE